VNCNARVRALVVVAGGGERAARGGARRGCLYEVKASDTQCYGKLSGALLSELDAQVRGGGAAAERLHGCRHLGAEAEVEIG
jgi:hypothetical protein